MHELTEIPAHDPLSDSPAAFILDNAVWMSLNGHHARFAEVNGRAMRYEVDVSPFAALSPECDIGAWDDLAALVGPKELVPLAGVHASPPAGWEVVQRGLGVQMVGLGTEPDEDPEAVRLGPHDVPEMLDLVARTTPGPFLPRTVELGSYLGIRRDGALVAMAGERLHPPGWTEISAVCTDARYRGRGLATRLVKAVVAGICNRGEIPFLHAAGTNVDAMRLYSSLGFTLRCQTVFLRVRTPGGQTSSVWPTPAGPAL